MRELGIDDPDEDEKERNEDGDDTPHVEEEWSESDARARDGRYRQDEPCNDDGCERCDPPDMPAHRRHSFRHLEPLDEPPLLEDDPGENSDDRHEEEVDGEREIRESTDPPERSILRHVCEHSDFLRLNPGPTLQAKKEAGNN